MRILYHHRTQGTGAEGVHISQIIKGFRLLGHSVSVVCPTGEDPLRTAGNNPFAATRNGLWRKLLSFFSRKAPQVFFELTEIAYNAWGYSRLNRVASRSKIDLIYERYGFFMTAGARVAKEKGIPYFVEVNEIAGPERVRKQVFTSMARKTEQRIFAQAAAIIVVSQFLKSTIEAMGIGNDKIHVIPNGADEEIFDPALYDRATIRTRLGLEGNQLVVGFVGWFVGWHNLELLLSGFSRIETQDSSLVFIGDGPLLPDLNRMVTRLGLGNRVIFAGSLPYADIPAAINALDICVIPDSNQYRSPIKMFEYMAMGKPVLAPDYEPIRSIIADEIDGMIYTPNDPEELASKMNRLLNDAALRERIGAAARSKILNHHLWKHNSQRIIDLLKYTKPTKYGSTGHYATSR